MYVCVCVNLTKFYFIHLYSSMYTYICVCFGWCLYEGYDTIVGVFIVI